MHEELSFQQLKPWFLAEVGSPVSVQITSRRGTVAFLEGSVEGVMGFETADSSGFSVQAAGGAWTLELAAPEFVSATLSPIPGAETSSQLMIKLRDHWLLIDVAGAPAMRGGRSSRP